MRSTTCVHRLFALFVNMLTKRRAEQLEKSGGGEADTDLKQAIDSFLVRYDAVNAEAGKGKRKLDSSKDDRQVTIRVRKNDERQEENGGAANGSEAGELSDVDVEATRVRKRSRGSKEPVRVDIGLDSAMSNMVGAFERAVASMAATPLPDDGRVCQLEKTVNELDHNVSNRLNSLESKLDILLDRLGR
ncbi:hypothetical protein V1520DRAFT_117720 [Lipomyces starkeyi]|uniref:Uncharacterized protein n=1 Tax=Lipomyces starkeyi NRRL Y-11557 TaxID=675824 RepID=A0A1E3Q2J5_LIPST|nr:hypothetical protein LIPSTDRAFT_329813 [Lipomyces starkeyi NRRL Y-11557]